MKLECGSNNNKCPICGKLLFLINDNEKACSDKECVYSIGEKQYFNGLTEDQWEEDKLNAYYKQIIVSGGEFNDKKENDIILHINKENIKDAKLILDYVSKQNISYASLNQNIKTNDDINIDRYNFGITINIINKVTEIFENKGYDFIIKKGYWFCKVNEWEEARLIILT